MKEVDSENNHLLDWFASSCQPVLERGFRLAFILCGTKDWGRSVADSLLGQAGKKSILVISRTIPGAIEPGKARSQLGMESDAILFDAHDDFDIDAFGAVSGTLRGGGIYIVLIPPETDFIAKPASRFRQRVITLFKHHPAVCFLQTDTSLPQLDLQQEISGKEHDCPEPFRTAEQQKVVATIIKNALLEKTAPIVIASDRGRGKSSALGLAAGYLLQQGVNNIIVTAPRLTTSEPVFRHAQQVLPAAESEQGRLVYNDSQLRFMAPDALLEQRPEADLLLVDEAAAIPLPMLEQLLLQYPCIVFSTTIHGYEGTGRGFVLKFNKVLDAFNPGWQQLKMNTPVRWAENDPLEQWVDRILCLDAELPEVPVIKNIVLENCHVSKIDRDALINDEQQLSSLFALLVYAHYRTQPSDLQHMLDDNNVRIYTLQFKQQILAAVLVNEEGGFDQALSSQVYRGERRPTGHLLAQTLTFHAGCEYASTLRYARVMRIAVHPQLQGNGLGSYLLDEVITHEQQQGVDAIGTSFGATLELLRFWQHAGFALVRLGFTRDHVSGTHSAVMLKPLNEKGEQVFRDTRVRFQRGLDEWLQEPLHDLPGDMQAYLLSEQQPGNSQLTEMDWQDINSFIHTNRGYEACMGALRRLVLANKAVLGRLDATAQTLVCTRIEQRKDWAETVRQAGMTGKTQALQQLRLAIEKIVNNLTEK